MLCGTGIARDRIELMMERMDVFVQIDRSPDMEQSVLPIRQTIEDSEIYDHLDNETAKMKLRMVAIRSNIMSVPYRGEHAAHEEGGHAVDVPFDGFTHSFFPIFFILFPCRWFVNGLFIEAFHDRSCNNRDDVYSDKVGGKF